MMEKHKKYNPHDRKFSLLGSIQAEGWLASLLERDLVGGFIGHLDDMLPALLKEDDIFGQDRINTRDFRTDLGVAEMDPDSLTQYAWWDSESFSNWLDGLFRSSVAIRNEQYRCKAESLIKHIIDTQDKDGYIGIYSNGLRYTHSVENGELWAQAAILRVLLSYYDYTQDESVLFAIKRAVSCTMSNYRLGGRNPFLVKGATAGVGHGLMFTDVLDTLYELTSDEEYIAYAAWLYDCYSESPQNECDIQIDRLLNRDESFVAHAVHTYEHVRSLISAILYDEQVYGPALDAYLMKLERCICPSGGPIGDEWICHNTADPSMHGYEYCSIHELFHSYIRLYQVTGNAVWVDAMEWLFFNAGIGAHHPENSSITYLKSDNCYSLEGVFQYPQPYCRTNIQVRYKYSPTHQDAAVCCVPNAGRLLSYYVQYSYARKEDEIVKLLYGDSCIDLQMKDAGVRIRELGGYPKTPGCSLEISVDTPVTFSLSLRVPSWADVCVVSGEEMPVKDHFVNIQNRWEGSILLTLEFRTHVMCREDLQSDRYLSYGPLVYSLPIACDEIVKKDFSPQNCSETYAVPKEEIPYHLAMCPLLVGKAVVEMQNEQDDWRYASLIRGDFYNRRTGEYEEKELYPLAGLILRKTTFPIHEGDEDR